LVCCVFSTAAVTAAGDAAAVADDALGVAVAVEAAGLDDAQPATSSASEAAPTAVTTRRLIRVFIAFSLE
jgi:hypothetical protein